LENRKMAGSAAEMAAMFNTEDTLDDWRSGKIDPQEYRDALSYELQRLLNPARR
jgi:hypothetical protein